MPSFSVMPACTAMIFARKMMFGLTLRKVMPISSRRAAVACVVSPWIHRLKYLANSTNTTKAKITRTTPATIMIIGKSSLAARCANRSRFIKGVLSFYRRVRTATLGDAIRYTPGGAAGRDSTQEFIQGPVLGHPHDELAAPQLD